MSRSGGIIFLISDQLSVIAHQSSFITGAFARGGLAQKEVSAEWPSAAKSNIDVTVRTPGLIRRAVIITCRLSGVSGRPAVSTQQSTHRYSVMMSAVSSDRYLWAMGYGLWAMAYGLWPMAYGLWPMGYGLWAMGYGLWPMGYEYGEDG